MNLARYRSANLWNTEGPSGKKSRSKRATLLSEAESLDPPASAYARCAAPAKPDMPLPDTELMAGNDCSYFVGGAISRDSVVLGQLAIACSSCEG